MYLLSTNYTVLSSRERCNIGFRNRERVKAAKGSCLFPPTGIYRYDKAAGVSGDTSPRAKRKGTGPVEKNPEEPEYA